MNILVADDELSMLKIIEAYLKKENFNVLTASDGEEALEKFYENKIDLAILDWMMPNIDGIEACKQIKEKSDTKVMMLTAKGQVDDEIDALNIGADDYIKKPFDPRLLIIRVKKLIGYNDIFKLKNLKVDLKQQKAFKDDKDLGLTKTEFELLKTLVNNKASILPREKLLDLVWGMDYYGDLRTVDTHIRRLRRKIGEEYITTHRGLGYCLEDVDD
ncbi:DNA-binding response regulator [[Clostridium] sordellii]|uniref:Stage 0 sporulation protein A homolog n=1 Tax=Paraclostridium sordellii TaxID=1505 RepID=A0ABM9RLJ4_PARSO|nr:response regulator transcription factor [Paeniclostridium sordellii]TAN67237.1 response regulator transcription factor [Paeniclostridium sordellii 8483]CEJ72883.1 two-component response regulator [[Clostridium] sordellii] [Paeniclostridium sordellii]CEK30787.1 DNA-binding response regulator [[Clostridium] sordellii] [Paeniclostridium sordellii]CEN68436.1 DNA-binding response regulator [[Clostridium] sordellii] [Paeniclostridium sordellii]CEN71703.1 DNA-binding response regulator [[Clostridi